MLNVAIHFAIGTVVALLIFLFFTRRSGVRSFSVPFAVFFVGFTCGLFAHFVSPWATPVLLILYGAASFNEYRQDRMAVSQSSQKANAESRSPIHPADPSADQ